MNSGNTALVSELTTAGAHFAHTKNRRHPSMQNFVFGTKSKVDLLDLTKVAGMLEKAKEVMRTLARDGKIVLFVGSKEEVRNLVSGSADTIAMPYVATRWLGGTLTNFDEIKKRIARLKELEDMTASEKFTKLERLMRSREATRLRTRLSGITSLEKLPDAMIIVDTKHEHIATHEAHMKNIPLIGLMSTDCNYNDAQYPIVANDTSLSSVRFILNQLATAYREGRDGVAEKSEVVS